MSTTATTPQQAPAESKKRFELPPWAEKAFIPVFFVVVALLPLGMSSGGQLIGDATLALAYVVMALGLNIIVGFAGLLDLGYVAFFAIGAHVAAWFGSAFWGVHLNFLITFRAGEPLFANLLLASLSRVG